jgi:hypothetical protein
MESGRQCNWCQRCLARLSRLAVGEVVDCHTSRRRVRCDWCVGGNRRARECVVVGLHPSRVLLADDSQVPPELQGEAAAVVALYGQFRAHMGTTTIEEVRDAAQSLVDQFQPANRRSGGRENASLGHLNAPLSGSQETDLRIVRALEAIVGLLAQANGVDNPLEGESSTSSDDDA